MLPVLFQFGPFTLHTYGLLLAVGFLISIQVVRRLAESAGTDPDLISKLAVHCLLVGIVTSRLMFVFTQFSFFAENPLDIFKIWQGGLVFYGGPMGVLPYFIYYARRERLNLWRTADLLIIGLTISHAFGRLGCFAAGCCFGKPTGSEWGVKFLHSDLVDASLRGIPLHPTQLYESFALLILAGALIQIFRKRAFDGQTFLAYGLTYPLIRSVVETFRGDIVRGFVVEDILSTGQFMSILVFGAAATMMVIRYKNREVKELRPARARRRS